MYDIRIRRSWTKKWIIFLWIKDDVWNYFLSGRLILVNVYRGGGRCQVNCLIGAIVDVIHTAKVSARISLWPGF